MKKTVTVMIMLGFCFTVPNFILAEEITIVGTGDGVNILKAVGEAFSQLNPAVTIEVPKSIGSGGGIKAVGTGKNQIGRVARPIKDKEKPYGLSYFEYARYPVVFFVNKGVRVRNLSAEQVCDIYSGKITNWKDVGGNDAKIRVVRREDGDSSLKVLRKSFPGFKDLTLTTKSKTAFSTPEAFFIVEGKANTICFGPYDVAKGADVHVVSIDGKGPTSAGYPSFGHLALVYKKENVNGNIKEFVEFATSPAAHEAIIKVGGVPL